MEVEKSAKEQSTCPDDEDVPEMTEERKAMMKKIDEILSQYYLNGV